MSESEKVTALANALSKVIDYHISEFHMTLAGVVGTLEVIKQGLINDQIKGQ